MLQLVGVVTQLINYFFSITRSLFIHIAQERKESRLKTQTALSKSHRCVTSSKTYLKAPLEAACPSSFHKAYETFAAKKVGINVGLNARVNAGLNVGANVGLPCFGRGSIKAGRGSITAGRASITVEAAIAVPIMIFAIYLLIFPIKVMESERKLQNTMEDVAKNLTLAPYINEAASDGLLSLSGDRKETFDNVLSGAEEGVGLATVLLSVEDEYLKDYGFSFDTSVLSEEGDAGSDMVYMKLDYSLNFPFTIIDAGEVDKSMVTNRRAWIGSKGGRGRNTYGEPLDEEGEEDEDDEDEMVYVAKNGENSKVYHTDSHCHYISNDFDSASVSDMDEITNKYGRKYTPCSSCDAADSHGTVYFTESGRKYHSSPDCKANRSMPESVKKSELVGYHECTYCAGKH